MRMCESWSAWILLRYPNRVRRRGTHHMAYLLLPWVVSCWLDRLIANSFIKLQFVRWSPEVRYLKGMTARLKQATWSICLRYCTIKLDFSSKRSLLFIYEGYFFIGNALWLMLIIMMSALESNIVDTLEGIQTLLYSGNLCIVSDQNLQLLIWTEFTETHWLLGAHIASKGQTRWNEFSAPFRLENGA